MRETGNPPRQLSSRWSSTPCGGRRRLSGDSVRSIWGLGKVRNVAGPKVRARPLSGSPGDSRRETLRAGLTALRSGAMPAAMFGSAAGALPRRGGRWRLRDWRLRTKLTAVLLLPLLLAGVLGALRVTDLLRKADESAALARQVGFAQQLGIVVHSLQGERYRVAAM